MRALGFILALASLAVQAAPLDGSVAVTEADLILTPSNSSLEARGPNDSYLRLWEGPCTGVYYESWVTGIQPKGTRSGCQGLKTDNKWRYFSLEGPQSLGFQIWTDIYCLGPGHFAPLSGWPGCYEIQGGVFAESFSVL